MSEMFAESIDEMLSAVFRKFEIPAAFAVAVKDDDVFIKTHGPKRLGEPAPVGPGTAFSIGSCSKAFCGAAAAALVDDGLVRWDEPVIDTLPEFALDDPWITRHTTLRDLLGMRVGLKRDGACEFPFNPTRSLADYLPMMGRLDRVAGFREKTSYMNGAYAAAALLLSRKSGLPYSDLVQKRIFAPAGMAHAVSRTGFLGQHPDPFTPHVRLHDELLPLPAPLCVGWEGSSAIYLSADDAARWLKLQIEGGAVGGRPVISQAAMSETRAPQSIDTPDPNTGEQFSLYAMGWRPFDYGGRRVYRHTGSELGATTMVAFCPEERLGLACVVNLYSPASIAAVYLMLDAFLGAPPKDWIDIMHKSFVERVANAIADVKERFPEGAVPGASPDGVQGHYHSPIYGSAAIYRSDRGLAFEMEDRAMLTADLLPVGEDVFDLKHHDVGMEQELLGAYMRLRFLRSAGRVDALDHALFGRFDRTSAP